MMADAEMTVQYEKRMAALDPRAADALAENVRQMGQYIGQLGVIVGSMQRRMEELEAKQAAVTILHDDVKRLQALIRNRAAELCEKYALDGAKDAQVIRAAIKKDLLKLYLVKDLHDLPAIARPGCEDRIRAWSNMRLIMSRRGIGSG